MFCLFVCSNFFGGFSCGVYFDVEVYLVGVCDIDFDIGDFGGVN